jgi:hypothetical protein
MFGGKMARRVKKDEPGKMAETAGDLVGVSA